MAEIKQAPEPEDIIWTNIGQNRIKFLFKKLFSFFIAVVFLGISFSITFGLSRAQYSYSRYSRSANR